ncbi:MAG: hypothetical protein KJ592_01255 [Nanoarchaeota archaeon]|nr:hypothetical protein [Nanoarchaeota archaeon]
MVRKNEVFSVVGCRLSGVGRRGKAGQMKIMQMMFMIVAVFFFFILVGLFFLMISLKDIRSGAEQLNRDQAISSLGTIADMSELNYGSGESMTIDKDKLRIMSGNFSRDYDSFWPVASIGVYLLYPTPDGMRKCPGTDCNYYEIYNNGQKGVETHSAFVSVCEKVEGDFDVCEVGKLEVGMRLIE